MAQGLKERLTEDMKSAMRAKEAQKLKVIRLVLAAIKQIELDERITLDEPQILAVIDNMLKQRRGSIDEFQKAGRDDLIEIEQYEIDLISTYLPEQLSSSDIAELVQKAMAEAKAESMKDMGKVMAILKPQLQGRADIGQVSGQVKQLLN